MSIIVPIYKKDDKTDWLLLLSTSYNILFNILLSTWTKLLGLISVAFEVKDPTTDQIFCICQILGMHIGYWWNSENESDH
jgi:hypothetical protein